MAKSTPELTPELIREVSQNVATGMLPRDAAALAGIDRPTFEDFMRRAREGKEPFLELSNEIRKADLTSQRRLLGGLSLLAPKDSRVATWFLARRWPQSWGDQALVQTDLEVHASDYKALAARMASRFPILPGESREDFEATVTALLAEHSPRGPTEESLVEELAGVHLRRGRLRLAEAAIQRRGLNETLPGFHGTVKAALAHLGEAKTEGTVADALTSTDEDSAAEIAFFEKARTEVERLVKILRPKSKRAYEAALAALGTERDEWWTEARARNPEDGKLYDADAEGLLAFLEGEVIPWYGSSTQEIENRPLIREQAFGESFNPEEIEPLRRIEDSLDRKMKSTLDTLLRLQELRRAKAG
jgi:hypothetical protein